MKKLVTTGAFGYPVTHNKRVLGGVMPDGGKDSMKKVSREEQLEVLMRCMQAINDKQSLSDEDWTLFKTYREKYYRLKFPQSFKRVRTKRKYPRIKFN
jgi:hypothetical protein